MNNFSGSEFRSKAAGFDISFSFRATRQSGYARRRRTRIGGNRRQSRSNASNDLRLTIWRYPRELTLQVLAWKIAPNLLSAVRRARVRGSLLAMKDLAVSCRSVALTVFGPANEHCSLPVEVLE